MRPIRKANEFRSREDGSVLVFFVVSIVAILGIVALSFDMGRRASTQTDMQSFSDNVALAAAGELDGQPDAITRARAAAVEAINAASETLKAGASGTAQALTFNPLTDLVFYTTLPATDTPASFATADLTASKYVLPTANTTTLGEEAAFVGVRLDTVDVDWMFAGLFGSDNLPDEAVGAIAIAGSAGYTCEVSPVMFCLPPVAGTSSPVELQTLAEGRAVQLRSVGRNAQWNAGQFGFLDIDWLLSDPNAAAGECASLSPESRRQACLLAQGINACFNSNGVEIQPGQRSGQETAGFNLPFGIFEQTMNTLRGAPGYEVGPHVVGGRQVSNNCRDTGASLDTAGFPLDDCHYASNCTDGRFGDGDWSDRRDTYLDVNYRHTETVSGLETEINSGSFFDFPDPSGRTLTRYEYYLLEIARAANGGRMPAEITLPETGRTYEFTDVNHTRTDTDGTPYNSWDDYWSTAPSTGFNPIIPDAHNRSEDGLPACSQVDQNANADRRVIIVAGIDCENQTLTGRESGVPVVQYYRSFMLGPATEISNSPSNGQMFDLWVEIIEPIGGEGPGGSSTADTAFRRLVQLYR